MKAKKPPLGLTPIEQLKLDVGYQIAELQVILSNKEDHHSSIVRQARVEMYVYEYIAKKNRNFN